jgi:ABC-type sugar transport system substrate-binding protein
MARSTIVRTLLAALAVFVLAPAPAAVRADDAALAIGTIPIDPTAEVYYAQEMGSRAAARSHRRSSAARSISGLPIRSR